MSTDTSHQLAAAATGDADALRALLEHFGPQIWSEIQREIGPAYKSLIDPDDVMQVTYLEAFLQIDRFTARDAAAFAAWLRRIAKNNLQDAIKELGRQKRPDPARRVHAPAGEESYVALVEQLGVTTTTPSRHAARSELVRMLDDVLSRLPKDYAQVVRLYDIEGRAIGEVAGALGRSSGAVHMLRARAHDHLRELLGGPGAYFSSSS